MYLKRKLFWLMKKCVWLFLGSLFWCWVLFWGLEGENILVRVLFGMLSSVECLVI